MSSISEVIHAHVDKILNEIHTSFPAKILRYDHDQSVADCSRRSKKFRDGTALESSSPARRANSFMRPGIA